MARLYSFPVCSVKGRPWSSGMNQNPVDKLLADGRSSSPSPLQLLTTSDVTEAGPRLVHPALNRYHRQPTASADPLIWPSIISTRASFSGQ